MEIIDKDNVNTAVKIAGVLLKNPVIAASGTFGFGREYSEFYKLSVLGGVSTKGTTLYPREGNPGCRVAETDSGMLNSVGLQNPGVDAFIEKELPFLSKQGTAVIANIAGNTEDDYCLAVQKLHNAPVDMIELNISCPNVKEGGMAFGVKPESVFDITKAVKLYCKQPLIVKLSPNVADIAENAKAAENAGADAISLINTITGMAVDHRTRRPILGNTVGGLSGKAVKPVALRMVWQVYNAVRVPIIGMGGIYTAADVLEFMICGASAVQVGTANITNPYACRDIVNGLTTLMAECNISDINEIVGTLKVN